MAIEKANAKSSKSNDSKSSKGADKSSKGADKKVKKVVGKAYLTIFGDFCCLASIGYEGEVVVNDNDSFEGTYTDPKKLARAIGLLITRRTVFKVELDEVAADMDSFNDAVDQLGWNEAESCFVPCNHPNSKTSKLVRVWYKVDADAKDFRPKTEQDDGTEDSPLIALIDRVAEIYIYAADISKKDAKAMELGKPITVPGLPPVYHVVKE